MKDNIINIIDITTTDIVSNIDTVFINNEVFVFKNTGLTRRVFVNKDKTLVVKVPIGRFDEEHNKKEAAMWKNGSDEVKEQLVESQLLPNGYLLQEFLQTIDDDTTKDWLGRNMTMQEIRFASSCRDDVGYDKNRKLKCYDYDEFKKY